MDKILIGFVVLALVVFCTLRVGAGFAAAVGLGRIPVPIIPVRLRRTLRFFLGEKN